VSNVTVQEAECHLVESRPCRVLTLFGHDGPVNTVAFSSDGRFLGTASGDGTVSLHLLPIDELRDMARERLGTRTLTDEECRQYLHTGCPVAI
jgi:hypothetical protein